MARPVGIREAARRALLGRMEFELTRIGAAIRGNARAIAELARKQEILKAERTRLVEVVRPLRRGVE